MSIEITTQLLRKYLKKSCTKEEEQTILKWIQTNDKETSILSLDEIKSMKLEIWDIIAPPLSSSKKNKFVSLYSNVFPYAIAASFLIGFFLCKDLIFQSNNNTKDIIQISTSYGKYVNLEVESALLEIDFNGQLQLINKSQTTKTIVICDKISKKIHLKPGNTYYLRKMKGVAYAVNENDLTENRDFSRYIRGDYSINFKYI